MVQPRRQKSGAGAGPIVRPTSERDLVMLDAGQARAPTCARTMTHATIAVAMLAAIGAPASWADPQPGAGPAPIVHASLPPSGAFDNHLTSKPIAASAASTGVIDLRPGAVIDASFGPALPSTAPRLSPVAPLAPLASKPAVASALATPYAGAPYQVAGKWYVPAYEPNYDEVGIASWYGPAFHGKASASGERFDQMAMTAAHPTLPIPSIVRVTNLENGKTALVRLNDRGPFVDDRIIDLSKHAGEVLGLHAKGTAKVRVQYVGPAPAEANELPSGTQATRVRDVAPLAPLTAQAATAPPLATAPSIPPVELSPATLPSPTLDARDVAPLKPRTAQTARQPAGDDAFYLQAGAFADPANAEALRARLAPFGAASVTRSDAGGRPLSRVMLGPWASRAEAEAVQARMANGGSKTLLVARAR